jgi:hypothetical protein
MHGTALHGKMQSMARHGIAVEAVARIVAG